MFNGSAPLAPPQRALSGYATSACHLGGASGRAGARAAACRAAAAQGGRGCSSRSGHRPGGPGGGSEVADGAEARRLRCVAAGATPNQRGAWQPSYDARTSGENGDLVRRAERLQLALREVGVELNKLPMPGIKFTHQTCPCCGRQARARPPTTLATRLHARIM